MKKILFFSAMVLMGTLNAQTEKQVNSNVSDFGKITYGEDARFKNHDKNLTTKAPTDVVISPLSQTISSGSAITDITSTPSIAGDYTTLDVITGGTPTLLGVANNGIFFDITNAGGSPLRVTAFDFVLYASTATTATETVPFTIYKTTSASTAVGNYTTSGAWTNLTGSATISLPATAASSGYLITSNLGANEFVLNAGQSVGIYIVCNNTATTGWKLGYRTNATSLTQVTDGTLTVTHRARATGLFATDATPALRGYYGNINYYAGYIGGWVRDNNVNVISNGTGNAGDDDNTVSAASTDDPICPITGDLTNTTTTDQVVSYTIDYWDVNNTAYEQIATVTVSAPLAVKEANKNSVKIFPNPVSDFIKISTTEKIKQVEIKDLTGRNVNSINSTDLIDVRSLSKGTYLLTIETDKGLQTLKFIKK